MRRRCPHRVAQAQVLTNGMNPPDRLGERGLPPWGTAPALNGKRPA